MGFLKRILRNGGPDEAAVLNPVGSFEQLSDAELQAHMEVDTYGAFDLTDAVRPSYDLRVVPRQGFRRDEYRDEHAGTRVPVLMAAASRHYLMDLFMDLIDGLGPVVDVVLETSHRAGGTHEDLYREHIDLPVLKSTLWDFEDLLLNDGCTGVAVVSPSRQQEVQFDEHKLLIVYGEPLDRFEGALIDRDVYPDPGIRFITEAEHVHSSSDSYFEQFGQLKMRLGMDGEW